ncbi:MAG: hypothetical protein ACFFBS_06025 [Promethearchaeota archaeon]
MKRAGLILVIGLLFFPLPETLTAVASQPILDAEDSVENAYQVILNADNAGANVTELVEQLNVAVELLGEARNIYEVNQTHAESLANQAKIIADAVREAALDLLTDIRSKGSIWFVLFPLGVIFVIVFVAVALYYSWRSMAAEEEEKLLETEISVPEQGDDCGKE